MTWIKIMIGLIMKGNNTLMLRTSGNEQWNVEEENDVIDYQTLNKEQRIVFDQIESHYNNVLAGQQVEPLRIIVMGTMETRKPYLIQAIQGQWQESGLNHLYSCLHQQVLQPSTSTE
jgi:hypothetical protein